MKALLLTYSIFIGHIFLAQCQISGQLYDWEGDAPTAIKSVRILGYDIISGSNFDGIFTLDYPELDDTIDIRIESYEGMTLTIENIDVSNHKVVNIGKIGMPTFDIIEIDEYNSLNKSQKKNCSPVHCWTELIGYVFKENLELDYLVVNCGKSKKKVENIEYDNINYDVKVNWDDLMICE